MGKTSEAQLQAVRRYRERNKDNPEYLARRRELAIASYARNAEKAKKRQCEYRKNNKEKIHQSKLKARKDVLIHYGGNPPRCACCGEQHSEFLAIDHVNGDGGARRKAGEPTGSGLCYWLRKQGYPEGFRILCHNCNLSLAFYGYCPHDGENNVR